MRKVHHQQRRRTLASQVSRMKEDHHHHEYDILSVSSPRVAVVMTPASTTTVCWDTRWDVYTEFELIAQRSGKCESCITPGKSAENLAGNTQNRPGLRMQFDMTPDWLLCPHPPHASCPFIVMESN